MLSTFKIKKEKERNKEKKRNGEIFLKIVDQPITDYF